MNKIASLLGLIALSGLAFAGKVYKWVDENGQTHYSSQKPPGQTAETVKIRKSPKVTQKVEPEKEAHQSDAPTKEPSDPKAEKEAREQMAKADAANRKKQCETARKNLAALNRSTRIARVDEETGQRTVMTDDERIKAFQQANQAIKENCN